MVLLRLYHSSSIWLLASHCRGQGSISGLFIPHLWQIKLHQRRFLTRALSIIIQSMFHNRVVQVQACEPHVTHWWNFCGPTNTHKKHKASHWYIWLKPAFDHKKQNVSFLSLVFFNPILSNPLSISWNNSWRYGVNECMYYPPKHYPFKK
jgi:hypothetical protein